MLTPLSFYAPISWLLLGFLDKFGSSCWTIVVLLFDREPGNKQGLELLEVVLLSLSLLIVLLCRIGHMLGAEGVVLSPGMTWAVIKQKYKVKFGEEDLQVIDNVFQLKTHAKHIPTAFIVCTDE